jgi:predicted DNA-binding transcriptional regulator AlpA
MSVYTTPQRPKKMLTILQAAKIATCGRNKIYKEQEAGRFPHSFHPPFSKRAVRWWEHEIEEFLELTASGICWQDRFVTRKANAETAKAEASLQAEARQEEYVRPTTTRLQFPAPSTPSRLIIPPGSLRAPNPPMFIKYYSSSASQAA